MSACENRKLRFPEERAPETGNKLDAMRAYRILLELYAEQHGIVIDYTLTHENGEVVNGRTDQSVFGEGDPARKRA